MAGGVAMGKAAMAMGLGKAAIAVSGGAGIGEIVMEVCWLPEYNLLFPHDLGMGIALAKMGTSWQSCGR